MREYLFRVVVPGGGGVEYLFRVVVIPGGGAEQQGTPAARERIKSGGGAREKKGNGDGVGEEQGKDGGGGRGTSPTARKRNTAAAKIIQRS
jgi:hypothetical protein